MAQQLLIVAGVALFACGLIWACNRWILQWLADRWLRKALAGIRAGLQPAAAIAHSACSLTIDSAAIHIKCTRPRSADRQTIFWEDVVRVVAFKRDCFTVDCICMSITTLDGTTAEVNEEMEGWSDLTEALPHYLCGSRTVGEWFSRVAFPAFALNETVIFEKGPSA
jgi:hypothetical protein